MLMRFNPKTHSIAQLSIPRDMLVSIPGNGQSKINAAYAWGGAALSVRTVRQFTGIPINHVMIVNMRGFPAMIDAVGGVDVYVPKTISSWYIGGRTVTFKRGWNHMDGARAEQYVRMRKVDSDFFRMARQQQVVQALQKKVATRGNLLRLPWIGKNMVRRIGTELSARQLIELAFLKWRTPQKHSYKLVMQGTPTYIGGVDYVVSDRATNLRMIKRFLSK
jgi:LCP family protein required for cell wall assembly